MPCPSDMVQIKIDSDCFCSHEYCSVTSLEYKEKVKYFKYDCIKPTTGEFKTVYDYQDRGCCQSNGTTGGYC
ncbi:hypothetical protein PCURB6_35720 [Paenibacillus curdlanolyticus]|nr:hypothetical protein PCURB6_35720 [Paenibacillus curdlanolyticus]